MINPTYVPQIRQIDDTIKSSRRNFLQNSLLGTAGLGIGIASTSETHAESAADATAPGITEDIDVLVVGGGTAGTIAAIQAGHAGRISILEKLRKEGRRLVHLQPETGFRETYRIEGETQITVNDYRTGRKFHDAVCHAFYPVDLHTRNGVKPEPLKRGVVPTIPLRALIPKGKPQPHRGRTLRQQRPARQLGTKGPGVEHGHGPGRRSRRRARPAFLVAARAGENRAWLERPPCPAMERFEMRADRMVFDYSPSDPSKLRLTVKAGPSFATDPPPQVAIWLENQGGYPIKTLLAPANAGETPYWALKHAGWDKAKREASGVDAVSSATPNGAFDPADYIVPKATKDATPYQLLLEIERTERCPAFNGTARRSIRAPEFRAALLLGIVQINGAVGVGAAEHIPRAFR